MIRLLRSVASFLRRLLWPMPKDLAPEGVRRGDNGHSDGDAPSAAAGIDLGSKDVTVVWHLQDGSTYTIDASSIELVRFGEDDPATEATTERPEPQREPGRQPIEMPGTGGPLASLFGGTAAWVGPSRRFRHAPWEDLHTFLGGKPRRDDYGLHFASEPVSLICPACELEQPPLKAGERGCPYCGLRIRVHGTHAIWWRPEITPALTWPPAGGAR